MSTPLHPLRNLAVLIVLLTSASTGISAPKTDPQTGLIIDEGFETVKKNCTVCHSAKLITQAGADREGWEEIIRWMQKTQNLWQFAPETEQVILDYLAKHYAANRTAGRRAPLVVEEWYPLSVDAPGKQGR